MEIKKTIESVEKIQAIMTGIRFNPDNIFPNFKLIKFENSSIKIKPINHIGPIITIEKPTFDKSSFTAGLKLRILTITKIKAPDISNKLKVPKERRILSNLSNVSLFLKY